MFKRKDGLWGDTLTRNGKTKYFYAKTKAELKRKMLEYSQAADSGWTLESLLERFEDEHGKTLRETTRKAYRAPISRINATFPGIYANELTPVKIQAFINDLSAQGYSRSTVQRPLDVLRMAYDFAIVSPDSGITSNPCTSVRLPKLSSKKRELIAREDVEIIKNSLGHPFGLFAYFLLYTGMRKGEALAITDKDIVNGHILVNKSVAWITNAPVINPPKTSSGSRTVPLLSPLSAVIPKGIHGYIFSTDGGKTPLTQREFNNRWHKYLHDVGLSDFEWETHKAANGHEYRKKVWHDRIVPHQLRHEFATMCLDAGLAEIDTKEILGHSDIRTTQAIYQHIQDSRRKSSTYKLEAFVSQS